MTGRRWTHGGERITETLKINVIQYNLYSLHKRKVHSAWIVWAKGHGVGCHIHIQIPIAPVFQLGLDKPR